MLIQFLPKKRKTIRRPEPHKDTDTQSDTSHDEEWEMPEHSDIYSSSSEDDPSSTIPMRFEQLTRERFLLGFPPQSPSSVSSTTYFPKLSECSTGEEQSKPKRNK